MKREKYIRIIVISLIMTLTLLLKMCECITVPWTILCDFIAMIGGGIFCSTIVSWIIDEQNKNKEKRAREEQRKYIFSSVKNSFIRLFERELFQLSNYYAEFMVKKPVKWIKEEINLPEMSKKLVWLLNEIEMAEEDEREGDILIITLESVRRDEEKRKYLVKNNEFYYRALHQILSELSTFYSTYMIAGLLNEEQIELLKELTWDIHDVMLFEPDIGVDDGTILVFKKSLFEKMSQYFSVFSILENEKVHVHYKDVFLK